MKNMRAVVHRKSGTAFNLEVHEFLFVYLEFDLHWLAANLAIFNIGLAASGQIDDDTHRFRAIRAANRSIEEPVRHVLIKAAIACRPTALH
jgi:hypothetical protein